MVFVFFFLTSLSAIMSCCCRWHYSFFFMAEQYSIVYLYHIFFVHSSVSGHLGCLHAFFHWRRKWPPTPVFLPRESQGWGSLVGCHLWGRTESDTTEVTQQQQQLWINSNLIKVRCVCETFSQKASQSSMLQEKDYQVGSYKDEVIDIKIKSNQ